MVAAAALVATGCSPFASDDPTSAPSGDGGASTDASPQADPTPSDAETPAADAPATP